MKCRVKVVYRSSDNQPVQEKIIEGCELKPYSQRPGTGYFIMKSPENEEETRFEGTDIEELIKQRRGEETDFIMKMKNPVIDIHVKLGITRGILRTSAISGFENLFRKPTNVDILSEKDYKETEIHDQIKYLAIYGVKMTVFDIRILNLHALRELDLSNNLLVTIPEELGNLSLDKVNLEYNLLGQAGETHWNWLKGENIRKSLRQLNIDDNRLTNIPAHIVELKQLELLKVGGNKIPVLPSIIARCDRLQYLQIGANLLTVLPGSMMSNSHFGYLHVGANFKTRPKKIAQVRNPTPTLKALAARIIIDQKLNYAKMIPTELIDYLDEAPVCSICIKACFEPYLCRIVYLHEKNMKYLASEFISSVRKIPFYYMFCSFKCAKTFKTGGFLWYDHL